MLVLSRAESESITIIVGGVSFSFMIRERRGNKVRISFDAPPEVQIIRTELLDPSSQQLATLQEATP